MRILQFDKRGTGMSDRSSSPPSFDVQMDDVRAVLDAAGVERAALFAWDDGGPPLAAFFAATHPDRTVALLIDPHIHGRRTPDYPFGETEDHFEGRIAEWMAVWGEQDRALGFDPPLDVELASWDAKSSRFAATPGSMAAFSRMWFDTDVRDVLPAIRVPTLVLCREGSEDTAAPNNAALVAKHIPGAQVASIPGTEEVVWIEEPEPFVRAIETFLASVREEEAEMDRVLATVLFTDIVGSSEKAAELGDRAWKELAERHHAVVRSLLARYRGTEVDTSGDGFFSSFDGPARAVRCAAAIREAMRTLGLEVRAGLHTGEVTGINDKIGGIGVTIGARIGSIAGGSEILVSSTVKDLVAGSGLTFEDAGEHELKGVPERWRLYRVVN